MYDNRILSWIGVRSAVYLSVVVVAAALSSNARADVATPPPTAPTQPTTTPTNITQAAHETPVERSLRQNFGFDPKNPVGTKIPAKKQFGSVQNGMATKTNPVRITDPYGNVVRTTVQTQTQLPPNSKLNQLIGGYAVGNIAGNIVNSENAKQAARDLAHRNFGSAAVNAAAAFDVFDIGSGLYGLFDEYENARAAIAQPMHDAAKAKAEAAAVAAQANGSDAVFDASQFAADPKTGKPQVYPRIAILTGFLNETHVLPEQFGGVSGSFSGGYYKYENTAYDPAFVVEFGQKLSQEQYEALEQSGVDTTTNIATIVVDDTNYHQYKDLIDDFVKQSTPTPTVTLEDFLLNEAEIQAVIANTLGQILSGQQQNTAVLTDLVNMLWSGNQLNASNTQTTVAGTPAQNTFLSAPYTPQGSNQAQQTQHVINKNGSITTTYIPRPDLKPNSKEAPTKNKLKDKKDRDDDDDKDKKPKKDDDDDDSSSKNKEKKDKDDEEELCTEENADRLMCVRAGSDVAKPLDIPHDEENIIFDKKDYFAKNGVCPAPLRFNAFGMDMEISYEPFCDFARGIRPIIEFLGILTAMGIAYGAVREL